MPRSARRANRFAPIAISMATLCTMASHSASAQAVIVVRHGEKLDASADPILSPEGTARAERLANMLTASKVRAIYITQFKWIQLLEVLRNTAPRHTTQRTTNSETVGRRRIQRADWQRRRTAKNFSLLYKTEGPVLAPLYDALSTAVYPDLARKMAMKIGSK
ncbi:MAG: hypothetical protein LH481_11680, partial [Burkholderiales bacterium]|nr:hypothetical protein [Burkholderiales bacterium]